MMKKWKSLFFVLLALNVIAAAVIVTLLVMPGEQAKIQDQTKSEYGFHITSSKESLARFVNAYLKEKASNQLDYKVDMTIACRGFSAFVETEVAIAFAVS